MEQERGRGRRLLALGGVTVLFVPLFLFFLFILSWVYPSRNGYPVCDPEFQPWCEHDPSVTLRWYLGVGGAAVAVVSLVVAYALPLRFRSWWVWALTALVLLPVSSWTLGSIFGG